MEDRPKNGVGVVQVILIMLFLREIGQDKLDAIIL